METMWVKDLTKKAQAEGQKGRELKNQIVDWKREWKARGTALMHDGMYAICPKIIAILSQLPDGNLYPTQICRARAKRRLELELLLGKEDWPAAAFRLFWILGRTNGHDLDLTRAWELKPYYKYMVRICEMLDYECGLGRDLSDQLMNAALKRIAGEYIKAIP
jgi:hypothetical protein